MKNKKALYFLVPAVLTIWGLIIYRVVGVVIDDEPTEIVSAPPNKPVQEEMRTYELVLNYPDPFLDQPVFKTTSQKAPIPKKVERKPAKREAPSQPSPKLRYNGGVENRESNAERHMVSINGKAYIVSIEEEKEGVKLMKVYSDSVLFRWNNQNLYVRR